VGTLFSENLTRYVNSTESEAIITLFPGQRALYRIPRSIYGTFLEHTGQSVFGGVSAQLLDNPSLEPYPASPENINKHFSAAVFRQSTRFNLPLPWLPLRSAGRRYELRSGNAANSASFLYVMGLPDREVGIRQPVYLPLERELAYRGVLFASAAEGAVALSVSFRRHDHPDDILAESTLQVPNHREWVKLSFQLKLPAGAVAPLETVDFAVAVKDDGRVSLDEIRLYPADADGGLDPEIIRWAKQLNSPLLRYGGNFSSGYHWLDGVGPLDSRPTRINEAWGVPEYNEFGTDELMELCRRIGSLPQICLNLGSGSVEEAREWVEYCQGSPNSAQGRRRASHGRSQPYAVGAWEFGNDGNMSGRNPAVRSPGYWNTDMSLSREFHISESKYFSFRWDVYNALNHQNLGIPNNRYCLPPNPDGSVDALHKFGCQFGKITNVQTDPRAMQFGIKFYW